jgi:hypothetical protein
MIPQTVPKRPMNGAVEPVVARKVRYFSSRCISRVVARPPAPGAAAPTEDVSDIEAAWAADTRHDAMDEASRRWAEAYLARAADASAPTEDHWERSITSPNTAPAPGTDAPAAGDDSARLTDLRTP